MERRKLLYTVDGNAKLSVATKENSMEITQEKKKKRERIELPYNPNITLRIFIQKIKKNKKLF